MRVSSNLKSVTEPDILKKLLFWSFRARRIQNDVFQVLGKICSRGFWGKRGPKSVQNEIFQVLTKINAWNFSDFLITVNII